MTIEEYFRDVSIRLEVLSEALDALQDEIRKNGARAFEEGDMPAVEDARRTLKSVEAFEKEWARLHNRWNAIQGPKEGPIGPGTKGEAQAREHVVLLGYELGVNRKREAVLPGSGIFDEQFQDLAEYAFARGELQSGRHATWRRREDGLLAPDKDEFCDEVSWSKSAYRHLEKALYRIAVRDGLMHDVGDTDVTIRNVSHEPQDGNM